MIKLNITKYDILDKQLTAFSTLHIIAKQILAIYISNKSQETLCLHVPKVSGEIKAYFGTTSYKQTKQDSVSYKVVKEETWELYVFSYN